MRLMDMDGWMLLAPSNPMASVKIGECRWICRANAGWELTLNPASLFIKTVSKPIANKLKQQAAEHERFRKVCISLAQVSALPSLHTLPISLTPLLP